MRKDVFSFREMALRWFDEARKFGQRQSRSANGRNKGGDAGVNWRPSRHFMVQVLWVVGIGSFLAITSPFGATKGQPPLIGWAYWTGFVGYGALAAHFIVPALEKLLGRWPRPVLYLVLSLTLAVVVSAGIVGMTMLTGEWVPFRFWPKLYGYVWVISIGITIVMVLRGQNNKTSLDQSANFENRIPAKIAGGTLYAINAEDHYLRIRTSRGEALILMRLGDALVELAGMDGLRTHRSWWVARAGVREVLRQNGKITLELRDGTMAPVSRTYAPDLRSAGWFS